MDTKIANAIVVSTKDIFNTMVFLQIKDGTAVENAANSKLFDFSGIIGLSGASTGAVGVHFSKDLAAKVASAMLGSTISESSSEVKDTVSELTNMIAGGMRNELSKHGIEFDISIPTVVAGDQHSTQTMVDAPSISIPFEVDGKSFIVEACIKNK